MYYFSPSRLVFNKSFKIWSDGVMISDERYEEIRQELLAGRTLTVAIGGYPVTIPPAIAPIEKDIVLLYRERLSLMNNDYEVAVAYLKQSYPLSEAITWPVQRDEAKATLAWVEANPETSIDEFPRELAPFIYDLYVSRRAEGIEGGLVDLAQRVLINDSMFSPALAKVTAHRHAVEKKMIAAVNDNDHAALRDITWRFAI